MHRVLVVLAVAATAHSGTGASLLSCAASVMSASIAHCRTPSAARSQPGPLIPATASSTVSPSLSSLASIRAQLQQLNRRIKHEPATATAPLPLPLPLSLSPITPLSPLSPATPYDSRSQHSSFDSPAAYTDSTLPLSSASFSDSPLTAT